jgi:hypothetical protein
LRDHLVVEGEALLVVDRRPYLENLKALSALEDRHGSAPGLASFLDFSSVLADHVSEEVDH